MKTETLVLIGAAAVAVWLLWPSGGVDDLIKPKDDVADEGQNGFDFSASGSYGGVSFQVAT